VKPKEIGRRILLRLAIILAVLYSLYPIIATGLDGMDLNLAALFAQNKLVLIGDVPFAQGIFTFNPIAYFDALNFQSFPARTVNSLVIAGGCGCNCVGGWNPSSLCACENRYPRSERNFFHALGD
jgi:hypothetical protein